MTPGSAQQLTLEGAYDLTPALKLAIKHVGFGSAWHVLYVACIDHPNLKAVLLDR